MMIVKNGVVIGDILENFLSCFLCWFVSLASLIFVYYCYKIGEVCVCPLFVDDVILLEINQLYSFYFYKG